MYVWRNNVFIGRFCQSTKKIRRRADFFVLMSYYLVAHAAVATEITARCALLERTCFVYRE